MSSSQCKISPKQGSQLIHGSKIWRVEKQAGRDCPGSGNSVAYCSFFFCYWPRLPDSFIKNPVCGTESPILRRIGLPPFPSRKNRRLSFPHLSHRHRKVQSRYDNLSFGAPGKADTIIDRAGYALGYIEYHEQPAWVIYKLTRAEATTKAAKRGDDFRENPQIPTGSATLADYRRSGYDRGHLAPAADMAFSSAT